MILNNENFLYILFQYLYKKNKNLLKFIQKRVDDEFQQEIDSLN